MTCIFGGTCRTRRLNNSQSALMLLLSQALRNPLPRNCRLGVASLSLKRSWVMRLRIIPVGPLSSGSSWSSCSDAKKNKGRQSGLLIRLYMNVETNIDIGVTIIAGLVSRRPSTRRSDDCGARSHSVNSSVLASHRTRPRYEDLNLLPSWRTISRSWAAVCGETPKIPSSSIGVTVVDAESREFVLLRERDD